MMRNNLLRSNCFSEEKHSIFAPITSDRDRRNLAHHVNLISKYDGIVTNIKRIQQWFVSPNSLNKTLQKWRYKRTIEFFKKRSHPKPRLPISSEGDKRVFSLGRWNARLPLSNKKLNRIKLDFDFKDLKSSKNKLSKTEPTDPVDESSEESTQEFIQKYERELLKFKQIVL